MQILGGASAATQNLPGFPVGLQRGWSKATGLVTVPPAGREDGSSCWGLWHYSEEQGLFPSFTCVEPFGNSLQDFFSLSWLLYWLSHPRSPCLPITALYRGCFKRKDWFSIKCLLKFLPTVIRLCGPSCFSPTIPFLSKSFKRSFPVVCMCVCVCICTPVSTYTGASRGRGRTLGVFCYYSPQYSLWSGSLTEPGAGPFS